MTNQHNQRYFIKYLYISVFLILVISCFPEEEYRNLKIDTNNALMVILDLETPRESGLTIDYWESGKPDRVSNKSTGISKNHHIVLYNLEPQSNYNFIIRKNNFQISDTLAFKTIGYPIREPKFSITVDSGNVFTGYILIRKVEFPSQQIILNNKGKIVWYQLLDSTVSRFFSWTEAHTILSLNTEEHIQEIDLEGNILCDLRMGEKGFTKPLHHEIIKDEKGRILSLTRNMKLFDLTEFGGVKNDTIFGDGILVLDSVGNKLWEWDIYEHEDPLQDKNIEKMKKDWSHGNALAIDLDGNYLVSFRNFHQIWKINSNSGTIIWKLGLAGDFNLDEKDLFYSQHSVFINKFEELMLFDNGLPEIRSRALSFMIGKDGKAEVGRYDVALPPRLYSFKEGSAYLITEDKILFCSTRNNVIAVTDNQGNILWELYSPEPFYRAYYLDEGVFN
jgi:arylsulfate sulfotransferase